MTLKQLFMNLALRSDHLLWTFSHNAYGKLALALKLLFAARLLGPDNFGLVAIALTTISIAEGLSETGFQSAVIQSKETPRLNVISSAWTIQAIRGLALSCIIAVAAHPIAIAFSSEKSEAIILSASLLPLLRSIINPGYTYLLRDLKNRQYALSEKLSHTIDITLTIAFLYTPFNIYAIIFGGIAGEVARLVLSWTLFRIDLKATRMWSEARYLIEYGKWIWVTSSTSVILNQFDKIVVAKFLGVLDFGLYQATSRIAQFLIADPCSSYSQYLFPRLSKQHHQNSKQGQEAYFSALRNVAFFGFIAAIATITFAEIILTTVLGDAWKKSTTILQASSISMFFGAIIAINVAYLKATGQTKIIAQGTIIQLTILIPSALYGAKQFGTIGAVFSASIALFFCMLYMIIRSCKKI